MCEVVASCFIESINSNMLLVKNMSVRSAYIVVIINDTIYCHGEYHEYTIKKYIKTVEAIMESGTVLIQPNKLSYSIYLNNKEIPLYNNKEIPLSWLFSISASIMRFANENRDLFERDGRQILK